MGNLNIGSILGEGWLKRVVPGRPGVPIDPSGASPAKPLPNIPNVGVKPFRPGARPASLPTFGPISSRPKPVDPGVSPEATVSPMGLPGTLSAAPVDPGVPGSPAPEAPASKAGTPSSVSKQLPTVPPIQAGNGGMVPRFFDVNLPDLSQSVAKPQATTLAKTSTGGEGDIPPTPPVDARGADGYTDAERAEIEDGTRAANASKLSEVESASDEETARLEAEKNAGGDDTDPRGLTPEQDLDDFLLDWFKTAAMAKEDPVSNAAFNRAIVQFGRLSQAQAQSLQSKMLSDPMLAGQSGGTAALMMAARDARMDLSDLVSQLGIEARKAVLEMNKYGVEGLAKLNEIRKKETDRDIENMAEAIKRLAAAGNTEGAKALFDRMKAKDPDRFDGIEFDGFLSGGEIDSLQNDARQNTLANGRISFSQGDVESAIGSLEAAYTEAERTERGQKLVRDNDLAEINKWLKAAGMDEVSDASELIGREGDVFVAKKLSEWAKESSTTTLDLAVDMVLRNLGVDGLNPEVESAVRSWLFNIQMTGGLTIGANGEVEIPPNAMIPPWDPKSPNQHLFYHWPVMDENGKVVGGFDNIYDEDSPKPDPEKDPEAFEYMEKMNRAWEEYVLNTPPDERMTREAWFYATNGGQNTDEDGNVVVDPDKIPGGTGGGGSRYSNFEYDDFVADMKNEKTGDLKSKLSDPDWVNAAALAGAIPKWSPSSLPSTNAEWNAAFKTVGNNNDQGIFVMDGKPYQVERYGSGYIRNIDGIGKVVVLSDPITGQRFIMKVHKPGTYAIEKVGYMVPVNEDGTYQWIPPGAVSKHPDGGKIRTLI